MSIEESLEEDDMTTSSGNENDMNKDNYYNINNNYNDDNITFNITNNKINGTPLVVFSCKDCDKILADSSSLLKEGNIDSYLCFKSTFIRFYTNIYKTYFTKKYKFNKNNLTNIFYILF